MSDQVRTTVTIYGEDYQLIGDLPESVVKALANHVDSQIRVLASRNPRVSVNRLAVLTALNLAAEYFELQEEHQKLVQEMQQQWRAKRGVKNDRFLGGRRRQVVQTRCTGRLSVRKRRWPGPMVRITTGHRRGRSSSIAGAITARERGKTRQLTGVSCQISPSMLSGMVGSVRIWTREV